MSSSYEIPITKSTRLLSFIEKFLIVSPSMRLLGTKMWTLSGVLSPVERSPT